MCQPVRFLYVLYPIIIISLAQMLSWMIGGVSEHNGKIRLLIDWLFYLFSVTGNKSIL